jgi:hypothetical protein
MVGPWVGALLLCAVSLAGPSGARVARADDPGAPDSASLEAPVDTTLKDATTQALSTGWKYRFEMTAPANDKFAITDRDYYLYFRPDSAAVHFQVKNRRGVAARILWDECTFTDTDGRQWRAVHRGIPYDRRDATQEPTWVQPNQTYADYLIPVSLLLDPNAAAGGQVRELLPTDLRARSLVGKIFSCRLVLEYTNDNLKSTYDCTFKIASTFRE